MSTPSAADLQQLNSALSVIDTIAAQYDIDNLLDKNRYREFQIASHLNHTMFTQSSGGKNNKDTYAADALDENNKKSEYKTKTLKEAEIRRLINKDEVAFLGVYNGAYTFDAISSYSDINHYFAVYVKTQPIFVVRIPTFEVLTQLTHMLLTSTKKTTNCNSVRMTYNIKGDDVDIVWQNDVLLAQLHEEFYVEPTIRITRTGKTIRTVRRSGEPTKLEFARIIFANHQINNRARPATITAFMDDLDMTAAGASTYYYNLVKELRST